MDTKTIRRIFSILQSRDPAPRTELEYRNDFTLLVAVVLSAQSTDVGVNKATRPLFDIADNPYDMAALGVEKLKSYINTIGLYNGKAKNVIGLSEMLIAKHNGEVPCDLKALQALPGVGAKTARVVMNCAFGKPYIAVDTHVFRVANRLGMVNEKTPEKTETALEKVVPQEFLTYAHHWLILHGRYICKARKPNCDACELSDFCEYFRSLQEISKIVETESAPIFCDNSIGIRCLNATAANAAATPTKQNIVARSHNLPLKFFNIHCHLGISLLTHYS